MTALGERTARPGITDVARCYRLFLGREPENAAVLGHHLAEAPDLWTLVEHVALSAEAGRRGAARACREIAAGYDPPTTPELGVDEIERLLAETVATWERDGLGIGYEALTRERVRYADGGTHWTAAQMFADGAAEGARIVATCRRHGVPLGGAVLMNLGSEAAGPAEALAPLVKTFVAVEVNEGERDAATRAIAARAIGNATVAPLAGFLSERPAHDVFHTAMTLQHAPPPVAEAILSRCLEALRPGGIAIVQLACQVHDDSVAAAEGGSIHALPQHRVLALFDRLGLLSLEVLPDGRAGVLGVSYTFVARKRC